MEPRILLIEDNPDLAKLVTMHLADLGCDVTHAADGVAVDAAIANSKASTFGSKADIEIGYS